MKLGLLFVLVSGAGLCVGCSDRANTGRGDGGSAGSSGSAGSAGSSGSGGTTSEVACGGESCSDGQACCVSIASSTASCGATCEGSTSAFRCDGPEDCDGNACCGTVAQGFACSGTNGCSSGVERCHVALDCSSGSQCVPASIGDISIDSCQP